MDSFYEEKSKGNNLLPNSGLRLSHCINKLQLQVNQLPWGVKTVSLPRLDLQNRTTWHCSAEEWSTSQYLLGLLAFCYFVILICPTSLQRCTTNRSLYSTMKVQTLGTWQPEIFLWPKLIRFQSSWKKKTYQYIHDKTQWTNCTACPSYIFNKTLV